MDEDEREIARRHEEYEERRGRLGACKTCGEPVLWWNTQWKTRVPLDPIPVADFADLLPDDVRGNLWVPTGRSAIVSIEGTKIYRVHNNGDCLKQQRQERIDEREGDA